MNYHLGGTTADVVNTLNKRSNSGWAREGTVIRSEDLPLLVGGLVLALAVGVGGKIIRKRKLTKGKPKKRKLFSFLHKKKR